MTFELGCSDLHVSLITLQRFVIALHPVCVGWRLSGESSRLCNLIALLNAAASRGHVGPPGTHAAILVMLRQRLLNYVSVCYLRR